MQDAYFNILLKSDEEQLILLCQSNKINYSICHDPYFWKLKFQQDDIPKMIPIYNNDLIDYYWTVKAIKTLKLLTVCYHILFYLNPKTYQVNVMANLFPKDYALKNLESSDFKLRIFMIGKGHYNVEYLGKLIFNNMGQQKLLSILKAHLPYIIPS